MKNSINQILLVCASPYATSFTNTNRTDNSKAFIGALQFMEGNDCTQNAVFNISTDDSRTIRKGDGEFFNDEARSVTISGVPRGTIIYIYDSPDGAKNDVWCKIKVRKDISSRCIGSFQKSFKDDEIELIYSKKDDSPNALDGKVSRVEVELF